MEAQDTVSSLLEVVESRPHARRFQFGIRPESQGVNAFEAKGLASGLEPSSVGHVGEDVMAIGQDVPLSQKPSLQKFCDLYGYGCGLDRGDIGRLFPDETRQSARFVRLLACVYVCVFVEGG